MLILVLFVSCGKKDDKPAPGKDAKTEATQKDDGKLKDLYTETPKLEMIPDAPIKAMANGKEFVVKGIVIEPTFDKWYIKFSDSALVKPDQMLQSFQCLNLEIPVIPEVNKPIEAKMESGHGYWQMIQTADPKATTSVNAQNAFILVFTKWDVKPFDEKANTSYQIAGTASGKVICCYKGFSDIKNSWLAGKFENVTVRYNGKPELKY